MKRTIFIPFAAGIAGPILYLTGHWIIAIAVTAVVLFFGAKWAATCGADTFR